MDTTQNSRPGPGPEPNPYDPRYLAGVDHFNRGEYFDAHEVWEELWGDCPAADRRFYQSLIQAAVALYHWGRNNPAGADRLFRSGRAYMAPYRPAHRGLDVDRFWQAVEAVVCQTPPPNPLPRGERGDQTEPDGSPSPTGGGGRKGGGDGPRVGSPHHPPRIDLDPPPPAPGPS
ncbi:MAG: DUF309 domain-containing protein [Gemmataceae bacterium]|nr:DUF309 domain-containing protein [Gemmataceae bacterium]